MTEKLVALAKAERFVMVVSRWHIIETAKMGSSILMPDEERKTLDQARFIDQFPTLIGLRPTQDLLIQEIARAYAKQVKAELVDDPPPFVSVGPLEDTIRDALAVDAGYVPRNRREARLEDGGRGSMGWWSWLDNEVHAAHKATFHAAQYGRDQAQRPRTWVTGLKERLTIKPLVHFLDDIANTLKPRIFAIGASAYHSSIADYLGFEPEMADYLRFLWAMEFTGSPALMYRKEYEAHLDPGGRRRPHVNDRTDAEHGFAAPFVDILVHERAHFEIARQAAKKVGLPCRVLNGAPKAKQLERVVQLVEGWERGDS